MSRPAGNTIMRLRDELDHSLFRPARQNAPSLKRWEAGVLIVAFVVLAAVLQLFRLGPSTALNSLWAEDGPVFVSGAMTHGFFDAVFTPWAEYLVVLPRLIAEIGTVVPLHDAPLAMNLTAVTLVALSGLAVWFASAGLIHSPYLRVLLVALLVLSPVGTIEAVATPTNVAWYTTFAVFWLLLWRPATMGGACLGGLLILLTGVSTPGTLFFAPLALMRAVAIRGRRDVVIVGSYTLGAAIQLIAMAVNTEKFTTPLWTKNILTAFLQRVVDNALLGIELGGSTWLDWGWPFLIAIVAAVATFLVVMLLRSSSNRLFAALAVVTAVVMFLASGYTRALGDVMVWHGDAYNNFGGRYAIVPAMLLLSAILALLDAHYRSSSKARRPALAIGIAAVLLASIVTSFDVRGVIGRGGPPWDESLRSATAKCEAKGLAEAPVSTSPEGWTVTVSCTRLTSDR
ncbi:MAG TPA: hypothetical protein VG898_06260 [Solirubrobacterales bacterium]|nr:hypothetical protein [Solirubrobacterales bacterium]